MASVVCVSVFATKTMKILKKPASQRHVKLLTALKTKEYVAVCVCVCACACVWFSLYEQKIVLQLTTSELLSSFYSHITIMV